MGDLDELVKGAFRSIYHHRAFHMQSSISILIRSYNSAKTLRILLSKLHLADDDEILIVDSGSTDSTVSIAREFGTKIINAPPPFNYSKSLNLGFAAAQNPWVLVLSSHSIPVVPDLLDIYRMVISTLPADVAVCYGPSVIDGRQDPGLPSQDASFYQSCDYQDVQRICGNANTFYRRDAWVTLPFDESIATAEDKAWLQQALCDGKRFAYLPQARCVNKNMGSLAYMFRKGQRDMRALRLSGRPPVPIRHLLGGIVRTIGRMLRGEINAGNCIRHCAHTLGQFVGSYRTPTNSAS